jgi:uncharacterized protein (DUF1684 family)
MLAETEDLDILYDDKLIVVFVKDGTINNVSQVLLVAFGKVHHGFRITLGRAMKTLSFRVFSDTLEQGTDCSGELFLAGCSLFGGGIESLACASA